MANISIYVPDQEPVAFDLTGIEQVTLGRGDECDIVLDHVSLSGSHATIQNVDGTLQLTDLGSTNGTFVNGEQITEAVVIGDGTQIMFGSVEAVLSEAGAEEAGAASGGLGSSSGGGSGYGAHVAELSDVSNRPDNFKNLSPIEKVVKKDVFAQVAIFIGILAILAAIAVIGVATTMSAS